MLQEDREKETGAACDNPENSATANFKQRKIWHNIRIINQNQMAIWLFNNIYYTLNKNENIREIIIKNEKK
jgi:hypothetical protein